MGRFAKLTQSPCHWACHCWRLLVLTDWCHKLCVYWLIVTNFSTSHFWWRLFCKTSESNCFKYITGNMHVKHGKTANENTLTSAIIFVICLYTGIMSFFILHEKHSAFFLSWKNKQIKPNQNRQNTPPNQTKQNPHKLRIISISCRCC